MKKKRILAVSSSFHYIHIICLDFHNEGFLALSSTFPGHFQCEKKFHTQIPWWTWIAPHRCPRCACQRWKVVMPGASGFWWRWLVGEKFVWRCFFFWFFLWVIFFLVKTRDAEWWASGTRMWIWQLGCYLVRYWTLLELIESQVTVVVMAAIVSVVIVSIPQEYLYYSIMSILIRTSCICVWSHSLRTLVRFTRTALVQK